MTSHGIDTPILASCTCDDDPDLQLLRDLLANDVDHYDACLIAFGHAPRDTAPWWVQRLWCRLEALRIGNDFRRRHGLPETPLVFRRVDLPVHVIIETDARAAVAGMRRLARAVQDVNQALRRISKVTADNETNAVRSFSEAFAKARHGLPRGLRRVDR